MTPRPAPVAATWFLKQFGSNTENESVIGDLFEQYQRGRGSFWYWRQVLSIVYMELLQEFRSDKRRFIAGLVKTWCVWGVMQFFAGMILMARFVSLHPEELPYGIQVSGFPILTLRTGSGLIYALRWGYILFLLILNTVPLLLVGRYCARSSRIHPKTMLLAFITTYVLWDAGWMAANLLVIARNLPTEVGLVVIIRDLIALPLAAGLILIGGMRASLSWRERVPRSGG